MKTEKGSKIRAAIAADRYAELHKPQPDKATARSNIELPVHFGGIYSREICDGKADVICTVGERDDWADEIKARGEFIQRAVNEHAALLATAYAVLEWARTPGNHAGNPYVKPFVQQAEIAIAAHEGRESEPWARDL